MKKKLLTLFLPFLFSYVNAGYNEHEKKVLVKNCLHYFEKGRILNSYTNKYFISETVERSDEYYEIIYQGKYYNLFFGYKIYDKNIKYIDGSECITINFDNHGEDD